MRLSFDSIEEVKEFVKGLKGTRGGKADADDAPATGQAPAPLQPPVTGPAAGFPGAGGFAAPAAGAAPAGGGPFAAVATGPAPEVLALVARIVAKIDAAVGSGQPADTALAWFRSECGKAGIDASSYNMDQIKQFALPKMAAPMLEQIAKLMNA